MEDDRMDVDSNLTLKKARKKAAIIRYEDKEGKATRLGKRGDIHYYSDRVIGHGATSIVYDGYFEVEHYKAAVKRLDSQYYDIYKDELEILRSVDHSNIIKYFATKEWEEGNKKLYYIAMERADITLEDCVDSNSRRYKQTPDVTLLKYIKGAANGLSWMHQKKRIIHRDIKPTNILVKFHPDNVAKLVDFGCSKKISSITEGTNSLGRGTCDWMAPEALLSRDDGKPFPNSYSVDVFSFGLTMFYTFTQGRHPFGTPIYMRSYNIVKGNLDLSYITTSNNHRHIMLHNLLTAMLSKNQKDRPKMSSVLEHPFFWNAKTKLEFILAVSNTLNSKEQSVTNIRDKVDLEFLKFLESRYGIHSFDWKSRCSQKVSNFINRYKKNYDGRSIVKLVEFIRDKDQHYVEWPADIKQQEEFGADGPSADETYVKYFETRVPELVTFLYVFFQQRQSRKLFRYYTSSIKWFGNM